MIVIYKYPVPIEDEFVIEVPAEYRIISVQAQRNEAFLWVAVDTSVESTAKLRFVLKGTGHAFTEEQAELLLGGDLEPVGTFQLFDGSLVFHLLFNVSSY